MLLLSARAARAVSVSFQPGTRRTAVCPRASSVVSSRRCVVAPLSTTTTRGGENRRFSPLTKLVTTIGPSSEEYEPLAKIVREGMSIMRLNFSHATPAEFFLRVGNLSKAPGGRYVATMLDTRGPEIRMGGLRVCKESGNRKAKVTLNEGDTLILTTDPSVDGDGDEKRMFVNYDKLPRKVRRGDSVLLDDGAITVTVVREDKGGDEDEEESTSEKKQDESSKEVVTRVANSGQLGERKGVNLPGIPLELPAMSKKDEADILFGCEHGIDIVAASFVHDAEGVRQITEYVASCARRFPERYQDSERPLVVAKIESVEALRNLNEIIDVSDGIMVARGDLGVEVPLVEVAQWQKDIVDACRARAKPVVIATQMLDSMSSNPRPTRAEVADVTNAVCEHADAVMLSGESAAGKYPVLSVATQRDICETTELWLGKSSSSLGYTAHHHHPPPQNNDTLNDKLAVAAVAAQRVAKAAAIVVTSADAARSVASHVPDVPILALLPATATRLARQLALYRAVFPILLEENSPFLDAPAAAIIARAELGLADADPVVALVGDAVSLPP